MVSTYMRPEFSDPATYETLEKRHRDNHELIVSLDTIYKQGFSGPEVMRDRLISLLETVDYLYDENKFPEVLFPHIVSSVSCGNTPVIYTELLEHFNDNQWVFHELNGLLTCLKNKKETANSIAEKGRLDWMRCVRHAKFRKSYKYSLWTYIRAIKSGNTDLLKWIIEDGCPIDDRSEICETIVRFGHLEMLKTFHGLGYPLSEICPDIAAENNHLEILKFLKDEQPEHFLYCGISAAKNNHLETLQWIVENGGVLYDIDYGNILSYAAENGHLQIMEWAYSKGCPVVRGALSGALESGDIVIVEWVLEHGIEWDPKFITVPIRCNNVYVLKWIHKKFGIPIDDVNLCKEAARYDRLDIIKWLRQLGCCWDEGAIEAAIQNGHLEMLEYLKNIGCPGCPDMCKLAAESNQFEVLKWLHEQGYSLHPDILKSGIVHGNIIMLEWAVDKGLRLSSDLTLYAARQLGGDLLLNLKWLRDKRVTFHNDTAVELVKRANWNGNLEALKWLVYAMGYVLNKTKCLSVASHPKVTEWLSTQR